MTAVILGFCVWLPSTISPPPALVYELPVGFRGRFEVELRKSLDFDGVTDEYVVRVSPSGNAHEPSDLMPRATLARFSDGRDIPVDVITGSSRWPDGELVVWLAGSEFSGDGSARRIGFVGSYADAVQDRKAWNREDR